MSSREQFDVIVVGGGMVGAALACALGLGGKRVALLEERLPKPFSLEDEAELRVSAISRASQALFESLSAWSGMIARRSSPFERMSVWDATGPGAIEFDSAEMGEPLLGHIIENRVVQLALLERLESIANVELITARPLSIDYRPDCVVVDLGEGVELRAALLVGADGAFSAVREAAGIKLESRSYAQSAIVCNVVTEKSHQRTAWQRFLPTGPLAFLPLSDGRCSIVWSCDTEFAEQKMALDGAAFLRELGAAFDYRLGEVISVGKRAIFPLVRRHSEQYVKPRLALVGDAAHTIHPLAGQGVNIGLLDIAALAEILLNADQDLGSLRLLRQYERWRRGNNMLMMHAMDGFYWLFGNNHLPLRQLRNFGLSLTNNLEPVKNRLMRHAMGVEGDLPKLSRGLAPSAGWLADR